MRKMNLCKVAQLTPAGDLTRVDLTDGGSFLVDFWFIESTYELADGRFARGTLAFVPASSPRCPAWFLDSE